MRDQSTRDAATIRAQQERIGELEETLRQEREANGPSQMLPAEWRLGPGQQRLILALYNAPGGFQTHDRLFLKVRLYSTESDPKLVVSQQVLRARRRLKDFGIEIKTRWGIGYELTPASRAIIKAALEQRAAA